MPLAEIDAIIAAMLRIVAAACLLILLIPSSLQAQVADRRQSASRAAYCIPWLGELRKTMRCDQVEQQLQALKPTDKSYAQWIAALSSLREACSTIVTNEQRSRAFVSLFLYEMTSADYRDTQALAAGSEVTFSLQAGEADARLCGAALASDEASRCEAACIGRYGAAVNEHLRECTLQCQPEICRRVSSRCGDVESRLPF